MKILIVIGVRRVREAGAAAVVFNHSEELQKLGHQVDCWFLDDVLPAPRWPARFQELEFGFAVSQRIRQDPGRYDVVNIHAPWGCVYGITRRLLGSAKLPPFVFTMQGSEARYVLAMRLESKKGRATNFAWKNRVWHRLYHQTMYDFSISTADYGAVANREGWILSELKYGHPPGRIWFVPNGTNLEFFQLHEYRDLPGIRLLYVGTWLDRKGIYYLVDSFALLASRLPELSLTVAGCILPAEEVKAYFPAELRSRVMVEPFVKREAMPGLYAAHDIFVFPSLMEGMPLTLLEAMASGMPVVTTNTCGMADVVEDGINGLLVPAADAALLSRAVERLCTSIELRKRLGAAAQETARRYTWQTVTLQLENVLQSALTSRNH
jgi:glycosyltransferase involved in cell wall biosynthesis